MATCRRNHACPACVQRSASTDPHDRGNASLRGAPLGPGIDAAELSEVAHPSTGPGAAPASLVQGSAAANGPRCAAERPGRSRAAPGGTRGPAARRGTRPPRGGARGRGEQPRCDRESLPALAPKGATLHTHGSHWTTPPGVNERPPPGRQLPPLHRVATAPEPTTGHPRFHLNGPVHQQLPRRYWCLGDWELAEDRRKAQNCLHPTKRGSVACARRTEA